MCMNLLVYVMYMIMICDLSLFNAQHEHTTHM
uniref:Uncharacterized protein n=1 Tax=Anguilla anguilla TaxID=7936 RepID=A0A0E9W0J2_ANGAN